MIDIIRFPVPESGSTVFPRIFPRRGGDEGMKPPDPFGIMLMARKRFFALHGSRFAWSML
jgi:hypothetical protein